MRILILTSMYPTELNPAYGSFVKTQVESLTKAGVEVDVLVFNPRKRKMKYPYAVLQLHQRLMHNSVDLVHAHYGLVGMVARTQSKVPVVVTFHGDDLLGSVINDRGEHTRMSRLIVAADKVLCRSIDAAIVQSKQMAAKIRGKRIYIIPHEVDFEIFRPLEREFARQALHLDPEKKYLLFAANPAYPVKRFTLANAVANQLREYDPAVELLVIYKEPQDRLALYMNACDALVFPSFQEGSPNIVKQSMACNLPIVATDVGDVREVIGDTPGCYICRPEVQDFIEKLLVILACRERTQGREAVRQFDPSLVTRKLICAYEEICSAGHRVWG